MKGENVIKTRFLYYIRAIQIKDMIKCRLNLISKNNDRAMFNFDGENVGFFVRTSC